MRDAVAAPDTRDRRLAQMFEAVIHEQGMGAQHADFPGTASPGLFSSRYQGATGLAMSSSKITVRS